ncbi:hypothetical protein KDX31_19695 (plasmid) [Amphritea atlantica]|uniref:Uncharacterized protein n=1 Tax=Amphritea atlantica TaxID=355243 RepID=A0ABY5H025_9GAMM|nr:hypothetical protein KDX31_19695 [Amphritea atlantica]
MNSKRSAEGKDKTLSADMNPLEEDDTRAGAKRSAIEQMDLSDALFLDTLLYDSVESCPRHVWLWDECRPIGELLH